MSGCPSCGGPVRCRRYHLCATATPMAKPRRPRDQAGSGGPTSLGILLRTDVQRSQVTSPNCKISLSITKMQPVLAALLFLLPYGFPGYSQVSFSVLLCVGFTPLSSSHYMNTFQSPLNDMADIHHMWSFLCQGKRLRSSGS